MAESDTKRAGTAGAPSNGASGKLVGLWNVTHRNIQNNASMQHSTTFGAVTQARNRFVSIRLLSMAPPAAIVASERISFLPKTRFRRVREGPFARA